MDALLTATPGFLPNPAFRIGLIYDDRTGRDAPARYCQRHLETLCNVRHLLPEHLGKIAQEDYDLFLRIDDGLDYAIPSTLFPRAWWVTDNRRQLSQNIESAYHFDWIFVAQQAMAAAMQSAGILNVWWLPLPLDPSLDKPDGQPQEVYHRFIPRDATEDIAAPAIGQAVPVGKMAVERWSEQGNIEAVDHEDFDRPFRDWPAGMGIVEPQRSSDGPNDQAAVMSTYAHRMAALFEIVMTVSGVQAQYFRHARSELLAIIPNTARSILDIGCATGKLGEAIKSRQSCRVTGIEMERRAAAEASKVLDVVQQGPAETLLNQLPNRSFDCIILADVLEHMGDPWGFLRELSQKLDDLASSCIVISIPNVAHWSVVLPLLRGEWTYADAGILDHTHLRFFTPQSAVRLVRGAGLEVESAQGVIFPRPEHLAKLDPITATHWVSSGLADTYQILLVCKKTNATAR